MSTHENEPQSSNPPSTLRPTALARFVQDESGQDLVEYALIAGVVGLAAVASAHGVAVSVSSAINIVGSGLTSAM